ncbi:hypothetical protein [Parabacteroides sp.]|uniref:hypothetical protein n=1 Tax=Parabacteroides sp. TaxID=1869337 RepID=UPI00257F0DB4|nr:hypothetical protein [Parabacteroides sp.]
MSVETAFGRKRIVLDPFSFGRERFWVRFPLFCVFFVLYLKRLKKQELNYDNIHPVSNSKKVPFAWLHQWQVSGVMQLVDHVLFNR